jgi:serralysin
MDGTSSADFLVGSSGNDLILGLEGDDTLDGGQGVDTLYGGMGDDLYRVDSAADRVLEVRDAELRDAGGYDTVLATCGFSLGSHVEALRLLGSAHIHGYGNALDNVLKGNRGDNVLAGGAGDDAIRGCAGDDRLLGGRGQDTLAGGRGNDVFEFHAVAESGDRTNLMDEIADFRRGQDLVDLSMIDADSTTATNEAFSGFIEASAEFSAAGQLRFEDGVLYGNTDGDRKAEFAIRLTGVTELSGADLVL